MAWQQEANIKGNKGDTGPPNSLAIGTVVTVPPGGAATADIIGTPPSQTLNLGIPRGNPGADSTVPGPPGTTDWNGIANKPATFPPTLPIAQSGVTNLVSDLAAKQATSAKGQANGYASLDATSKVPAAQLPSYVDDVLEFANLAAFPATGTAGIIYIALDTNKVYRWGGSSYTEISPSPGSTDAVPEGSTNKYYTDARAQAANAAAIALKVAKAGDTMTGALTIQPASGAAIETLKSTDNGVTINIDKAAGAFANQIVGYRAGSARWLLQLGNATAESGSNAGSDFAINAYSDAGAFLNSPLIGERKTGLMTVIGDPTVGLGIATKQYVDARVAAKNRIVNPVMQHSQETGGASGSTTAYYIADQWLLAFSGLASAIGRSATTDPFYAPFYLSITPSAAKPSLAAGDYGMIQQPIEGQRLPDLYWGSANARPIVVRFSAQASVAGNYALAIRNGAANRSYVVPIALTVAPKVFTVAIPGDTTGTWPVDNTFALSLAIVGYAGTTVQAPSTGQWVAGNYLGFAGMANLAATAGQTLVLGQVGLYVDAQNVGLPPPWETPLAVDVLQECFRYWRPCPTIFGRWHPTTTTLFACYGSILPVMRVIPVGAIMSGGTVNEIWVAGRAITGIPTLSLTVTGDLSMQLNTAAATAAAFGNLNPTSIALNSRM